MLACPFDVPKYEWNSINPRVTKCDMCFPLIREGKKPACVEECPTEARLFGIRDDLINEAGRRIQTNPQSYQHHIFGAQEVGGTSVLFLAQKPFDRLGLKTDLPPYPLSTLTQPVLSKIPRYVFLAGTLLTATWWITNRRKKVQEYKRKETESKRRDSSELPKPKDYEKGKEIFTAHSRLPRPTFWSGAFWIVILLGIISAVIRFTQGLGAATNLSDQHPWGLWIGFDILCGVGLASGGFVIAAAVLIFNLERYRPFLRPAILTALLGYLLVITALLFDLGRPWKVWHQIIMWNPKSVMFEVGWCVMLYTLVLALEFSPAVLERLNFEHPRRFLYAVSTPLVIAGVILSSLHQSSLGALYLIVPEKVYPLWYSSSLPYLFFFSAVAVGPCMVVIETCLGSRAFHQKIELAALSQLGKVTLFALVIYLALKIQDMIKNRSVSYLFTLNLESLLYWLEILAGVIVPIVLLLIPRIRSNKRGLLMCALLTVLGFIMSRLNLSVTAFKGYAGTCYFPSWMEVSITLMIVTVGIAAYRFAAKAFPISSPNR
jgi:Ni/Fe-hydrogenase subunit HybB-like protein